MNSSTEPKSQIEQLPTSGTGPAASGFPLPSPSGPGSKVRKLPARGGGGSKVLPLAIAGVLLTAGAAVGGWYYFRPTPVRADVLLHTVKREPLVVSVTEKGTLESADNRDIVCRVKAGSKGFASTINWVIDDGSRVKPGQLLMILDDSALSDQADAQNIVVSQASSASLKAETDRKITETQNEITVATAVNTLELAEIELEKFTGLGVDPTRAALGAVGGGIATLSESGAFRQDVDNATGEVRQYESDVEQNRERSAWADRMVKLSYMSSAQAQAERSKLDSSVERLRSSRAKLTQLLTYDRKQRLTDLTSKRDNAVRALHQAREEAKAKLYLALREEGLRKSILHDETTKLGEIAQQRAECKITAPETIEPDSMVVYFRNESNRFGSSSSSGLIEQGAQVKEGQKLLRIPNLHRMQVNTKVHEAMVARIRGDVRVPTHIVDTLQGFWQLTPDPLGRVVRQRPEATDWMRERFRNESYKKLSEGQKASIRVDALPDRVFEGHVRTVAAVASQADSWISDVKLYQTLVTVDYEVFPDGTKKRIENEQLKPDMTAEVTITVDTAKEPVLTVPVQSVIGGTEMGTTRKVYVKTLTGYELKEVKLGLYNEKFVEIREGLAEGDEVVMNPKVLLAPDDKTRTRDGDSKNAGSKGADGNKGADPKGDGKTGAPGAGGAGKKKGAGGPPPGSP